MVQEQVRVRSAVRSAQLREIELGLLRRRQERAPRGFQARLRPSEKDAVAAVPGRVVLGEHDPSLATGRNRVDAPSGNGHRGLAHADVLARRAVECGTPAYDKIVKRWGTSIIGLGFGPS